MPARSSERLASKPKITWRSSKGPDTSVAAKFGEVKQPLRDRLKNEAAKLKAAATARSTRGAQLQQAAQQSSAKATAEDSDEEQQYFLDQARSQQYLQQQEKQQHLQQQKQKSHRPVTRRALQKPSETEQV